MDVYDQFSGHIERWKSSWGQQLRTEKKDVLKPSGPVRLLAAADAAWGIPWMPRPKISQKVHGEPAEPPQSGNASTLIDLQREVEAAFPFCDSLREAKTCVFGEGDPHASLVFVGEAPGAEEDRVGRPFVGAAGKKLDDILRAMGFARESVYICNVLKARPPGNRTPLPDEVALSEPWLSAQLRLIRPQVIVSLGGPASKLILQTDLGITRLRGRWGEWKDPDSELTIPVMPTFHPAYLLRVYTEEVRRQVWQDMQAVMESIKSTAQS